MLAKVAVRDYVIVRLGMGDCRVTEIHNGLLCWREDRFCCNLRGY